MTRRYVLAWSAGCCLGVAVGALAGSVVRVAADFRRLRRPEPGPGAPQPPSGHSETTEALIGAHSGAQRLIPAQRDDEPCPVTLGPLTCPFRGTHTNHAFQSATWAPDAKADADERIE